MERNNHQEKQVQDAFVNPILQSQTNRIVQLPTPDLSPDFLEMDRKLKQIDLKDPNPLLCARIFFKFNESIPAYAGIHKAELKLALNIFEYSLEVYIEDKSSSFIDQVSKGLDVNSYLSDLCKTDPLLALLHRRLYEEAKARNIELTEEATLIITTLWKKRIAYLLQQPALYDYPIDSSPSDVKTVRQIVDNVCNLHQDHHIKQVFKDVLKQTKVTFEKVNEDGTLDVTPFPFEFICCPSGSGKSTFAMNMCCESSFSAFLLFSKTRIKNSQEDVFLPNYMQPIYKPFVGISEPFLIVSTNEHAKFSSKNFSSIKQFTRYLDTTRFELFGLIVAFIEEMDRLKTEYPDKTWLELEVMIAKLTYAEMSGNDARRKLESFKKKNVLPLTIFIDEATVMDEDVMMQMITLQTAIGYLGIVPVFIGTDARAINILKRCPEFHSGFGGGDIDCCNIFNYLPEFDIFRLNGLCNKLQETYANSRPVLAFLDFLRAVYLNEVPYFVELALEYLLVNKFDSNTDQAIDYFDALFYNVFEQFALRKNFEIGFFRGQIQYPLFYSWCKSFDDKGVTGIGLKRLQLPEKNINHHLGYLLGDPRIQKGPYFTIVSKVIKNEEVTIPNSSAKTGEKYIKCEGTVSATPYGPKTVFMSFEDAPLTGMVLYGIGPKHRPFKSSKYANDSCTVLGGLGRAYERGRRITGRNNGQPLEKLVNLSVIVASRAKGPGGLTFSDFFISFIRQMATRHLNDRNFFVVDGLDEPYWSSIRVPFVAPMAISNWSQEAVMFFSEICNEELDLGIMHPSINDDPADCIVYRVNASLEPAKQKIKIGIHPLPRRARSSIFDKSRKQCALVIECKQYNRPLQSSEVTTIVKSFENQMFEDCKVFIIVAVEIAEEANAEIDGFDLWRLASTVNVTGAGEDGDDYEDDGYDEDYEDIDEYREKKHNPFRYQLLPLNTVERRSSPRLTGPAAVAKPVILLELKTLWSEKMFATHCDLLEYQS